MKKFLLIVVLGLFPLGAIGSCDAEDGIPSVRMLSYLSPDVDFSKEFRDTEGRIYFNYKTSAATAQKAPVDISDDEDGSVTITLKIGGEMGRGEAIDDEDDGSVTIHLNLGSTIASPSSAGPATSSEDGDGGSVYVPEAGDSREKVLAQIDRRKEVLTPKGFPWNAHGHMLLKYSTKVYIGSGTMVGARLVLTAAHNLYDITTKESVKEISFFPGLGRGDSLTSPIRGSKGISMKIHKSYCNPGRGENPQEYDIGILMLQDSLADCWYGIKSLPDPSLMKVKINVSGYPGDRDFGRVMYSMSGKLKRITDRQLFYDIDTAGGQSGSGVWYTHHEGIAHFCIGVHAYGGDTENSATRINSDVETKLLVWQERLLKTLPKPDVKKRKRT